MLLYCNNDGIILMFAYILLCGVIGENSSFDKALRMFLGEFKLPGEAQCIDRYVYTIFPCYSSGSCFNLFI